MQKSHHNTSSTLLDSRLRWWCPSNYSLSCVDAIGVADAPAEPSMLAPRWKSPENSTMSSRLDGGGRGAVERASAARP